MNSLRSHSTSSSNSGHPSHDQINLEEIIEYHIDSPNSDFWCQLCALPHTDCICSYTTSSNNSYHAYSPANPNVAVFPGTDINDYTCEPNSYDQSYDPTYTCTTSEASSTSHYSIPSSTTPALLPKTSNWSPIAPAEKPNGGIGAYSSCQFDTSSKRGKRRGVMAPEEAREKRLQQNRRSQRSFRDRQAKLVEDLKTKVEILTEENEKLINELSALGMRDGSSRAGSERGGSI